VRWLSFCVRWSFGPPNALDVWRSSDYGRPVTKRLARRSSQVASTMALCIAVVVLTFAWGGCDDNGVSSVVATDTGVADTSVVVDTADPIGSRRAFAVATYNVERFFDTQCDSSDCGGSAYEEFPSLSQFERQADRLAAAMASLDADVLLLQEVETQACVDALTARLGPDFPAAVIGELGWAGSVDVAVISKWPIARVQRHADAPIPHPINGTTTFAREFLEVELDVEGAAVIVFVAHFKSKFNDDRWRRVGEATAAREIVSARIADRPDAMVIMGGDLNDVPGSLPMDALVANGVLFRVSEVLDASDDWTITFQGRRQAIDHILIPAARREQLIDGGVSVFHDIDVIGFGGGYGGSDHGAVRAVIGIDIPGAVPR
jgi:endonuclease/exonuclease/phosphatase family metal-dependent hydrolase